MTTWTTTTKHCTGKREKEERSIKMPVRLCSVRNKDGNKHRTLSKRVRVESLVKRHFSRYLINWLDIRPECRFVGNSIHAHSLRTDNQNYPRFYLIEIACDWFFLCDFRLQKKSWTICRCYSRICSAQNRGSQNARGWHIRKRELYELQFESTSARARAASNRALPNCQILT